MAPHGCARFAGEKTKTNVRSTRVSAKVVSSALKAP